MRRIAIAGLAAVALPLVLDSCDRGGDGDSKPAGRVDVEPGSPRVRPRDLAASFLEDGRLRLRSVSMGVAIQAPPQAAGLLAYCSTPRTRRDVSERFGPSGVDLFDGLVESGMLVDPTAPQDVHFLQNFASVAVHRRMIADEVRLAAFREALRRHVTPESVVIDAGAGTGALAVYAALAGARRVYAIEMSDIVDVIPLVARDSGVADRITVIRGDFSRVALPEKADIIVTETFGAWALAEGAAEDLEKLIERYLEPGGRCIPSHVELWAAGIRDEPEEVAAPFRAREDGLALQALAGLARARSVNVAVPPDRLVDGSARRIARLALTEGRFDGSLRLEAPCAALALWFVLELDEETRLSTAPDAPATHWSQTVIGARLPAGDHAIVVQPAPEDRRSVQLLLGGSEFRIR